MESAALRDASLNATESPRVRRAAVARRRGRVGTGRALWGGGILATCADSSCC